MNCAQVLWLDFKVLAVFGCMCRRRTVLRCVACDSLSFICLAVFRRHFVLHFNVF